MMKKSFFLFFVFIPFFCFGKSTKETILFEPQYLPEKTYEQITKKNTETIIAFSGSKKEMKKLKANNIKNQNIINEQKETLSAIKTGKMSSDSIFPILIHVLKSTSGSGKIDLPDGLLIYGKCHPGGIPILDSIGADNYNDSQKEFFIGLLQKMITQFSMEKTTLKTGDSFSKKTPMSIPFSGTSASELNMDIVITYKLKH
ncbi:hypothetical protein LJC11_01700 [Bacteroidales bacterium OttesenSCG-928-I21]|nr:hypothetical protein [Bacteroidales bacterium OttesenSCG-928-I21]